MASDSWEQVRQRHERALTHYVRLAGSLDDSAWSAPVADAKWTPREITEHLRAAYQMAIKELEGGTGFRPRMGPLMRTFLRIVYLPRIIRTRQMPKGVKAPGEIRPTSCIADRIEALSVLQEVGSRVEAEFGARLSDPDAFITHHLLGKFKPQQAVDFITIHLEHHTRQLPNHHE